MTQPTAVAYTFDKFPAELRNSKSWVLWRLEDSDKRERCKVPYNTTTLRGASSMDPTHWTALDTCLQRINRDFKAIDKYKDTPYSFGVGCVVHGDYVGVDLDHCYDDTKMQLDEFAGKFMSQVPRTYTELTPSRSGLHLWYKLAPGVKKPEKQGIRTKKAEVYLSGRYLTVTGWAAGNDGMTEIHALTQDELNALIAAVESTREKKLETSTKESPKFSSDKFTDYMTKHDFPDLSAIVHSLCVMLLRKHALDHAKADAEFRTSDIYLNTHWKEKWERLGKDELIKCEDLAREWLQRDVARKQKSGESLTPGSDGFSLTDTGNAMRLASAFGEDLCFVPAMKSYYIWNGRFWDHEFSSSSVYQCAKKVVIKLKEDASTTEDHDQQKAMMRWAWESEGRSRMDNMQMMARNEVLQRHVSDFDAKHELIAFSNGVYDLNTNEFRDHRREDLCARVIDYDYDHRADCPTWIKFITRIQPKTNILDFIQRSLGYSASGFDRLNYIWFLIGESGANGKSTFVETLQKVFGNYSRVLEFASLMQRESRGPSGDLARLQGARFVSGCESDEGQRLSAAVIKRLTGGDTIQASYKFKDEFEFQPTHKIWLATNHPPQLPSGDDGLWRRVIKIPFDIQIPENERDGRLKEKLRLELPGIMNWVLQGWRNYQERQLMVSDVPELQESRDKYRDDLNEVKYFLNENVDPQSEKDVIDRGDIGSGELYQKFKEWFMLTHGRKSNPMAQRSFSNRMLKMGFDTIHTKTGAKFKNIGVLIRNQGSLSSKQDSPF